MHVLDTTLRDGSYAVNFRFTSHDTKVLGAKLEEAGFQWIEIGHGVGLGASEKGKGEAIATDEEYLKAASETFNSAKYGMFCIPGIAELEHIDLAAQYGMKFIRIGTNVTEVESSQKFIERAKGYGMYVTANYMKSYAIHPTKFAELALLSQKYGADLLCVVDSAGGMLKEELELYFKAVQDVSDIPLGFHGHHNLGLGVSHSIEAVKLGAVMVDGSMQGFGRSSGNAPTEQIVACLDRMGLDHGIDLIKLMDISETYIKPLIRKRGHSSLDIICGYSQFHSSYMKTVQKYSSKYEVDPRLIIIELCKVNKMDAPDSLVNEIAQNISEHSDNFFTGRFGLADYFGEEQS